MKCTLCDQEAITTAAHIPVCEKHWQMYKEEGQQYLSHRPFWELLQKAYDCPFEVEVHQPCKPTPQRITYTGCKITDIVEDDAGTTITFTYTDKKEE